ncbi:MAG TPA: hypothetical protein VFA63_12565 [Pseudonocardiaceae bacterium]|nr:hypothetical protein [Pseudonocardiaceae bacterium]
MPEGESESGYHSFRKKRIDGTSPSPRRNLLAVLADLILDEELRAREAQEGPPEPRPSVVWFPTWVRRLYGAIPLPRDCTLGPSSKIRAVVGDAAGLYFVRDPSARIAVELVEQPPPARTGIPAPLLVAVDERTAEKQRTEKHDYDKVSVDRMNLPVHDRGKLRLTWHREKWTRAKSFHDLAPKWPDEWTTLTQWAADFDSARPRWPDILCMHVVATCREASGDYVLLSQRPVMEEDSYYPGAWAFSFEEQCRPGKAYTDEVLRAVGEELVDPAVAAQCRAQLLGVALMQSILNLVLLIHVSVPGTFTEFLEWHNGATDPDETRQWAALPLSRQTLAACAAGPNLPDALRSQALAGDPDLFGDTDRWQLHPTSLMRLALAVWRAESLAALRENPTSTLP